MLDEYTYIASGLTDGVGGDASRVLIGVDIKQLYDGFARGRDLSRRRPKACRDLSDSLSTL